MPILWPSADGTIVGTRRGEDSPARIDCLDPSEECRYWFMSIVRRAPYCYVYLCRVMMMIYYIWDAERGVDLLFDVVATSIMLMKLPITECSESDEK